MDFMQALRERAARDPQRIVFFEGDNQKIIQAAEVLTKESLAHCTLLGSRTAIEKSASSVEVSLDGIEIIDLDDADTNESFAMRFAAIPDCPLSAKGSRRRSGKPIYRALMMQRLGDVDISFGGIDCPTGDVIYCGQSILGLADGVDTVSSVGILDIPGWHGGKDGLLAFGDSAVCADPNPEQLASIAISCCDTIRGLCGWEPLCAMLSYSTDGSAESKLVDKVREAVAIANNRRPDLSIDGEFQLDAAIDVSAASKKVLRESRVAGHANIVIWPDINAGNIGVKLVQQFAHASAYGPLLQGFKQIVCDCSRSAPVDELVGNAVMSCVRSQALREV